MESSDSAWERFKQGSDTESVQKASLAEKLDILASQLNEVVTNTRNVAKLAPELMGDQSAIDAANMAAPAGDMGGGDMGGLPDPTALAEEMAGQLGGDETMNPEDEIMMDGGAPEAPEEMPAPEAPMAEAPMPEEAALDMPVDEVAPEMPMPEAPMPEEPIPDMAEDMLAPPAPADNVLDMYNSDVAFEDLIMTLTDELHEAADAKDYAKVQAISEKLEGLQATWDGFGDVPITEAAMSAAGAEDMVPPEVIDAIAGGAAPEIPPEALMKAEKDDDESEPSEKAEDEKGDEPEPKAEPELMEGDYDEEDFIEESLAQAPQEEMMPEIDPMAQSLMELMALLEAGQVDDAKAIIASLLQANAPVAKSEGESLDVAAGSGDLGDGDSESVALSEEDAPVGDAVDTPVEKGCDDEPVVKSEQFHIESISEMMARRSGYVSPSSDSAVGGDIMRPRANPFAVRKSVAHTSPIGSVGISTDDDWERYKAYKSQSLF